MQTARLARMSLLCAISSILICASPLSFAQSAYTPDVGNVGLPSNGVFSGGSVDTVQLNNGNLHIDIPLLHLPGIGLDTDIHLTYDSQIWNHATGPISPTSPTIWELVTMSRPPWQTKDPLTGYLKWGYHTLQWDCSLISGSVYQGVGSNTDIDFMSFTDEDGTAHSLPVSGMLHNGGPIPLCNLNGVVGTWPAIDTNSDSSNGLYPVFSIDQAGYRLAIDGTATPKSFFDRNGTKFTFSTSTTSGGVGLPPIIATTPDQCIGSACGSTYNPGSATNINYLTINTIEDSNGNKITRNSTGFIDTVDRQITESFTASSSCPTVPTTPARLGVGSDSLVTTPNTIQYVDQSGNTQTITVCYGLAPVSLEPICGSNANCGSELGVTSNSGSIVVPTSIILQNGDTYLFSYTPNPGDTYSMGEITSITLPTGGTISYTYGGISAPYSGRYLLSRTVTENGQSSMWKYHYGGGKVTVTDPYSNDTVYTCTAFATGSNVPSCYMTKEIAYNGSAFSQNPLVTKSTGYTVVGASRMPTSEVLTWNSSGATTETDTVFDVFTPPVSGTSYCVQSEGICSTTLTMGNVMSKAAYDYGNGTHGALLSNTIHSYLHQNNSAYVDLNMLDRPAQTSVYNSLTASSSTLVAQSTTAYDAFNQTAQSGLAQTTGTAQHDYTSYSTARTMRGLPTSVAKYVNPSTTITTYTNYNDLGKPTVTTDALGNQTLYAYGTQNAFLASTTMPPASGVTHIVSVNHDVATGLLISQTDQNTNQTLYTYDNMMRPLTVKRPDGGLTTYTYPDPNHVNAVTTLDASRISTTIVTMDGIGRKILTSTSSDTYCQSQSVQTTYDLLGRVQTVSNPHCVPSADTDGLTTYSYDAVGRLYNKMNPDASSQNWSFNGNVIDFYDETSRHWQHTYDAADRLTKVMEPDGTTTVPNTPSLETDYSYDTLGNLLRVDQWGGANGSSNDHARVFAYDALSRLVASNNPESASASSPAAQTCTGTTSGTHWTTCYTYDNNSNLLSKKDNRGISITYAYDVLNRVTGKTYSDSTPPVSFNYDTSTISGASKDIGELTRSAVSLGSAKLAETFPYAYDSMGRLLAEQQCTAINCTGTMYQVNTTYDYAGKPLTETFPSNAPLGTHTSGQPLTLTYVLDAVERPTSVTSSWVATGDTKHPATLFQTPTTSPGYGPVGLLNATLGVSTYPSGVAALNRAYDARGRVVSEVDTPTGDSSLPTDSTGTITIAGTEQTLSRTAKPGSLTLTVSGTDGSTMICSYQTVCNPGNTVCWQQVILPCPQVPNSGGFTFTVWADEFTSYTATAGYAGGSTDAQIATALAASVNASGAPVGAIASGNMVIITATTTGPSTNYPFTITNSISGGPGYGISPNVPYGSLGGNLAGGVTANPSDSGTISITVSGNVTTIPFGTGSTSTNLATTLMNAINAQDGSYVTATNPSAGKVALTSAGTGSAVDWHLTESVTYDSSDFSAASFTATDNGMTGGVDVTNALYSYSIPLAGGYDANGNLLISVDSVMGRWNYSYDNLNRLINAAAPTSQPTGVNAYFAGVQSGWSYDAFGNRLSETQGAIAGATPTASMPTSSSATYTTGGNQLATSSLASGLTYDAAGDITYDGTNAYLYDAEGRICASENGSGTMTGYIYDGAGIRVAKASLTSFSCAFASNGYKITSSYVLGAGGEQVTEYSVSGTTQTWVHTNAFAGGKLLASYHDIDTYFALEDWLGTKRMEITPDGLTATYRSLPYGNGYVASGTALDATEQHFTGKERDLETGDDYFEARYYASNLGRFMSPDRPVDQRKEDPQSFNLYTYVRNNPMTHTDPSGRYDCDAKTSTCQAAQAAALKINIAAHDIWNPNMYALQKISDSLGTFGDNNGVVINSADLGAPSSNGNYVGAQTVKNGMGPNGAGSTITFNSNSMIHQTNDEFTVGQVHEVTHAQQNSLAERFHYTSAFEGWIYEQTGGGKSSRADFLTDETPAYTNQGYMEQALHMKGQIYDPSLKGEAERRHMQNQVTRWAGIDANVRCEDQGGCDK